MFDYDKFFREQPLNIHDQPERHLKIAELCLGKVIDIGCGTGSLTDYFKGEYEGYDVSSVAINKAQQNRRKNTIFCCVDFTLVTDYDFSKHDTIVMSEFLEHVENDHNIFDSIKKTAKPGTRLIVSVPNYKNVPSPDHVREFTFLQLREKLEKLGRVRFQNWSGENARMIVLVIIGEKRQDILSLGIIAKDEEKGIEHAIISALGVCDHVYILVDDSTTDKTEEIAKRYTEFVSLYKWTGDFSAARNKLMQKLFTPWILFLDGHEYLKKRPSVDLMNEEKFDSFMCQIELESGSIVRYPRIHKSDLVFHDKLHNTLDTKSVGVDKKILIVHDRIKSQNKKSVENRELQRDKMMNEIMIKEIRRSPSNTRASLHLGLHFQARLQYKKAIKYYKLYLKYSKYFPERWFIRWNLTLCYYSLGQLWRAELHAIQLERESPDRWETDHILGMVNMAQKNYLKASEFFVKSFECKEQEAEYKPIKRNRSITWNLIGDCFFNLAKFSDAGIAFRRSGDLCENKDFKMVALKRADLMEKMSVANFEK